MRQEEENKQVVYSYLAGFLDGEGSIYVCLVRRSKGINISVRVSISQSKRDEVLLLYKKNFGGSLTNAMVGKGKKKKIHFFYVASQVIAHNLIKILFPYLIMKRKQAELALRMFEIRNIKDEKSVKELLKLAKELAILNRSEKRVSQVINVEEREYLEQRMRERKKIYG